MNITDTYIENGIKVKVLKGCEFKPRPARSTFADLSPEYYAMMQGELV